MLNNAEIIVSLIIITLSLAISISGFVVARTTMMKSLMVVWIAYITTQGLALAVGTEFSALYIYNGALSFILWVAIKERAYTK